jgi:acyl CoA:acetate/3-ketoacid CoA transferase alpha subunit
MLSHHANRFTITSSKLLANPREFVSRIPSGSKILVGGFGLCGIPENLIRYTRECGIKDLIIASNTCGTVDWGLGILL